MSDTPQPDSLTEILLDEFIQALGLKPGRLSRALVRPFFGLPASRFAALKSLSVTAMGMPELRSGPAGRPMSSLSWR